MTPMTPPAFCTLQNDDQSGKKETTTTNLMLSVKFAAASNINVKHKNANNPMSAILFRNATILQNGGKQQKRGLNTSPINDQQTLTIRGTQR